MDQLSPRVPWLSASDFEEAERATWTVLRGERERLSCWPVRTYDVDGVSTKYLMVHAVRGNGNDGGEIGMSLSDHPRYDLYAREALVIAAPSQSQPKRYITSEDTWR